MTSVSLPSTSVAAGVVPTSKNQYYVCPIYEDEAIPWNPYTKGEILTEHTYLSYFGGVFAEMERLLDHEGLTVYFTWRTDVLPSYGPDVVAVVVGDEWGQYPLYTNRVRAVFKMMGTDFPFEATPFQTPHQLTAVTALKYLRTQMHRVPHLLQAGWDRRGGPRWAPRTPTPIFDLPIGYVNQDDLPLKPLEDREFDLYFSGSVTNERFRWYSPQYWLSSPKDVARSALCRAMRQIQEDDPDLSVVLDVWDSYIPNAGPYTKPVSDRSYSEMMMDTRICPVPRGTRLETGRLYEAMRYGCVLITEPLPDRWFLRGMPAITLHDWKQLPGIVDELLADPARMNALHKSTRQWWTEKCSETAVGRYMAERLTAVLTEE